MTPNDTGGGVVNVSLSYGSYGGWVDISKYGSVWLRVRIRLRNVYCSKLRPNIAASGATRAVWFVTLVSK